jgi:WD40 repeat protein
MAAAAVVVVALVTASVVSIRKAAIASAAMRVANESKLRAEAESARAQQNEARALLNEYVADVTLAHEALAAGNFGRAHSLLSKHEPAKGKTDLRGFEWGYLNRLSQGDPHDVLISSGESVRSVAFSNDGKLIAVGAREKAIVLNAENHRTLCVSTGAAFSVAFSADASHLFIADPFSIRDLNLTDRSQKVVATGIGAPIAVSSDGHWLAGANREGVRVFEANPFTGKRTLFHASGPLAFSSDNKKLLTASKNGYSLWPLDSDDEPLEFSAPSSFNFFLQFSRTLVINPDGTRFYAPQDKMVNVFDVNARAQIATIPEDKKPLHLGAIGAMALSPDGKTLATASWDHSIQLWDANSHTHLRSLRGHLNEVWSIAFSPDGKTVLSGAKDGGLFLWPLEQAQTNVTTDFVAGNWHPIGFSGDDKTFVAIDRTTGGISAVNVETGALEEILTGIHSQGARFGPGGFGARASASADLNIIARHDSDGGIEVIDRAAHRKFSLGDRERISSLSVAPDGKSIVTTTWGGAVTQWDIRTSMSRALPLHGDRATFSPDSKRLIVLNREGTASVWDIAADQLDHTFTLEVPGLGCVVSPDNRTLAVAAMPDLSNTILLVDLITGKTIGTLFGHKQGVGPLAFSPDGKTLASSSADGSLKLWNIPTLQEILTFPVQASSIVFSPHGDYLVFSARGADSEGIQVLRASFPDRID